MVAVKRQDEYIYIHICMIYLFAGFNVTKDSVNRSHFFDFIFCKNHTAYIILHKYSSAHFYVVRSMVNLVGGTYKITTGKIETIHFHRHSG